MHHKSSGHWFVVLTKRLLLFGFILAFGFFGTASAALIDRNDGTVGVSPSTGAFWRHARHAAYRATVHQVMKEFHIPGLVAGVWVPGDRAWKIAEGFGDVRSGRPIALDDHFPIRSITKSFTVTLILQLVRDGKISLDDPIEQYVPGIPTAARLRLRSWPRWRAG